MAKTKKPEAKKAAAPKPQRRASDVPQRRATDKPKNAEQLLTLDVGYQQARQSAATYLHGRRQAAFALARRYHLDADDLMQEGYEILLTCLRDFQPLRKNDETGET